jgi:hypothetical protein
MDLNKTIADLLRKQEAWQENMRDVLLPFKAVNLATRHDLIGVAGEKFTIIDENEKIEHALSDHATGQFCARHKLPKDHWQRIEEDAPHEIRESFADHVNTILDGGYGRQTREDGEIRWRLYDGDEGVGPYIRAVMTDRYGTFDPIDALRCTQKAVDFLDQNGQTFALVQSHQDMDRLTMRLINPLMSKGDFEERGGTMTGHHGGHAWLDDNRGGNGGGEKIYPGISVRTSGDGSSSIEVLPFTFRGGCTNGILIDVRESEAAMRRRHVGRSAKLLQHEFNLAITNAFAESEKLAENFLALQDHQIEDPLKEIIKMCEKGKKKKIDGMNDVLVEAAKGALPAYMQYGNTMYTAVNAITQAAQTLDDDTQQEVEKFMGSLVMEMATEGRERQ